LPFDYSYLFVILVLLALGMGSQAAIKHTYKRWRQLRVGVGMSGAQVARQMLNAHGLSGVPVQAVSGSLSDHFDPRSNTVRLSQETYEGTNVSAIAVACHECGHAVQYAQAYTPMRVRSAIVPVVNFCSNVWFPVLMVGLLLSFLGLVWAAIILYVAVILFQLVTLPVEFDASRRGLAYMRQSFGLQPLEYKGARSVLRAAAMTYVAAALLSLLYLVFTLAYVNND
jgi:Zn-dependent membrane protease YugP